MHKVQTNCPNCGAVMQTDKCDHCGTILYDFACLDADQPFFIKIKRGNTVHRLKVCLTEASFDYHMNNGATLYCDDTPYVFMRSPYSEMDLHFRILPYKNDNQEILAMGINTDEIDPHERPY